MKPAARWQPLPLPAQTILFYSGSLSHTDSVSFSHWMKKGTTDINLVLSVLDVSSTGLDIRSRISSAKKRRGRSLATFRIWGLLEFPEHAGVELGVIPNSFLVGLAARRLQTACPCGD